MRKILIPGIILLLFIVTFFFGFFWWRGNTKPTSLKEEYKAFVIPRGYSATQIGNKLEDEGFIKDAFAFKFYVQISGSTKEIKAGRFSLSPHLSLTEIVKLLTKGPKDIWVTIPEGLRREEIVQRFIDGLEKEGQDASIFYDEFMDKSQEYEGFLFPDTYLFPREASATSVIKYLRETFTKKIKEYEDGISGSNLDLNEIVTLASLIERETKTVEERPVVAGILFNRLEIEMPLQVDAAVQYAVADAECRMPNAILRQAQDDAEQDRSIKCKNWWPILTREDLEIDSLYNTYKYEGLPPAPIANPGISSLKAAIFPQETSYFYYIHDETGNIHYAKTLQEHNENIRKYLGK